MKPWMFATLLVLADCTALVVVGVLVRVGLCPIALALPIITGILAGSRIPKAIRVLQGRDDDDDQPPTAPGIASTRRAALVTSGVLTIVLGLGAWLNLVRPRAVA